MATWILAIRREPSIAAELIEGHIKDLLVEDEAEVEPCGATSRVALLPG